MVMVEYQPRPMRALDGHDPADEHDVIACPVQCVMPAFEPRDAAVDQRGIRPAEPVRDSGESVGVRP